MTKRTCVVDGCSNDLRGCQQICDEHKDHCTESGCKEPRSGRSRHCKIHKNYNAKPEIRDGLRRCRRCEKFLPESAFNRLSRTRGGLLDRCKSCLRDIRLADGRKAAVWREQNREHIREYTNQYRPRALELANRRNAVIRSRTIPFTAEQLAARFSYFGNRCWICGAEAEHVDHVKPIKIGGWNMLSNIRPACARCNWRKKTLWPITDIELEKIRAE